MAAVVEAAANFRAFADFRCILIEVLESAPARALFKKMVFLTIPCPDSMDGDDKTDYPCLARPC